MKMKSMHALRLLVNPGPGVCLGLVGVSLTLGCGGLGSEQELGTTVAEVKAAPNVDVRRSLAITDQPIVEAFSLERVLNQILDTAGVQGQTATELFQQWWDTQNPAPGEGYGPVCESEFNDYPLDCRPAPDEEGGQANCDPFETDSACAYIPIGLFMRFDLAPNDGDYCGEYRIIFARESGRDGGRDRNLLIFEAAMRNAHYQQGIRGCQKFVREWAELSEEDDISERKERLEALYFDGFKEWDPIVQYSNYGDNTKGVGQVRSNQFIQPGEERSWSLREFKIYRETVGSDYALRFLPQTVKVSPPGLLFNPDSSHPNAQAFQSDFIGQVESLAVSDLNQISMNNANIYNPGQSESSGANKDDYVAAFTGGTSTVFADAIQAELTALGSTLSPENIVARAQAMSCAGCHRLNDGLDIGGGLTWPVAGGFVHVSERDVDLEVAGGVTRFGISAALVDEFLPTRKQLLEDFLNEVPPPSQPAGAPLGRRWTH
jgi:hypothetical protein